MQKKTVKASSKFGPKNNPVARVMGSVRQAVRDPKLGIVTGHVWQKGKAYAHALHLRSLGARRRVLAKLAAEGKTEADLVKAGLSLVLYAAPLDLVKVPLYKGLPPDVAAKQGRIWPRSRNQEASLAA